MEIIKQAGVVLHTNGSEIRAFFTRVKQTKVFKKFFESLGRTTKGPTPSYNYNNAAIQQIQADKLTLRTKSLGIMMSWLHEHHTHEKYVEMYYRIDLNKTNMNRKSHGGHTIKTPFMFSCI